MRSDALDLDLERNLPIRARPASFEAAPALRMAIGGVRASHADKQRFRGGDVD